MVQRFRFIAVAIVAVVAFTVILNVGNVHALPPPTVVFTPNPVPQGTDVVVTGSGFNPSQSVGGTIAVFPDASCGGLAVSKTASSDSSGNLNPVTFPTGAFAVGTHCVEIIGPLVPGETLVTSFDVSAAPPIPEYPLGLPLLAILVVIGYSVIRRKTRN